jgi:hypothetical protein
MNNTFAWDIARISKTIRCSNIEFPDRTIFLILQIYYTRYKKGLSIEHFQYALEVVIVKYHEGSLPDTGDNFLKYLQGVIRNIIIDL